MNYCIAEPADRERMVDFANYVFSQAHRPHDFKTLLPKVYADDAPETAIHYIACREDGAIRAMVANLPVRLRFGDAALQAGMIGTVSVHPYARGEGHMKRLMQMMLDDARARKLDLLVLGGMRQRYGYFGFESGGAAAAYDITETNVRRGLADVNADGIVFQEIASEDCEGFDFAWRLANARRIGGERPKADFLRIMRSWDSHLRLIARDGRPIGYAMGDSAKKRLEGQVCELGLASESDLYPVLKALFAQDGVGSVTLIAGPHEVERAELLGRIAEHVQIVSHERICVLNWQRVLAATLAAKAEYARLSDGEVALQIGEETLLMKVENGRASVSATNRTPDRVLEEKEAVRTLFGVENALFGDSLFKNWLPLPLYFSPADTF